MMSVEDVNLLKKIAREVQEISELCDGYSSKNTRSKISELADCVMLSLAVLISNAWKDKEPERGGY